MKSALSQFMHDRHKRASKALGYALTLDDQSGWDGASVVWSARLTTGERAALLLSALASLDLDEALFLLKHTIGGAGYPLPAFLGGMDDARFWAASASRSELKAYALACFEAMPSGDQAAFFQHISNIEVAA